MARDNLSYVSDSKNSANSSAMSLTLRQMQEVLSGPVFWMIICASVLLTAMAGPYFTLERLSFPERLVYWATTIVVSAGVMTFLSIFAYRLSDGRGWNWAIVAFAAGVVGTLPVVGTIYLADGIIAGFSPGWTAQTPFGRLTAYTAPSVIGVTMIVNAVIHRQMASQDAATDAAPAVPPAPTILQSKLPHHLGHDIISVRAQDHYVEVTTPQGSAMVLMRLGDAIEDLKPLDGLQVHRSWWVALRHVQRTEKGSNGPELVLSSDQRVPVGRSFRTAYRAATEH